MIRRDHQSAWALIPQTAHARLAADLARDWCAPRLESFRWFDVLRSAIATHDDGWAEYEQVPTIAPETGIPRDFTEMPMTVSTAFWSRGIVAAAERDPWCALWISDHFCRLAEFASASRRDNADDMAAIHHFQQEQSALKKEWRAEVRKRSPDPDEDERFGVECVRFFDRVSLWLSCAPPTTPWNVTTPDGSEVCWTPVTESDIEVAPYPWSSSPRTLEVTGHLIPARVYLDDTDLRRTLLSAPPVVFRWSLVGRRDRKTSESVQQETT